MEDMKVYPANQYLSSEKREGYKLIIQLPFQK